MAPQVHAGNSAHVTGQGSTEAATNTWQAVHWSHFQGMHAHLQLAHMHLLRQANLERSRVSHSFTQTVRQWCIAACAHALKGRLHKLL